MIDIARLIFKAPYYKFGHKNNSGQGRGGYLKYIATRDGVELLRSGMVNYIGERKGSNGLFSDEGISIDLVKIGNEIDTHNGNVWGLIFSLKREDAERLGYNTPEQWMNLLRSRRNDIAKEMHIAPENLCWYAAYHSAKTHPHVHMLVWSKDPKEPYLSTVGIHNIKHTIARDIFRQDMISIYKEQTNIRDELKEIFRQKLEDISKKFQSSSADISPEFYEKFSELCEKISSHKGKKVYGYLDKKTKDTVDGIVKMIANDKDISDAYELWYQLQCESYRTYTDEMPSRIPLEENKEFKSIRNQVVSVAANIKIPPKQPWRDVFYDYEYLRDKKDDIYYLETLANRGNVMAMYRVGRYYYDKTDDMDEALYWLKSAADEGNILSMYLVYKGYRDGKFKENPSDKMKYLLMAVDKNFGYAEYEYALLTDKKMPNVKLSYLQRAAEHGCEQAEYEIGSLYYENGQIEQALEYFEKAAKGDLWVQTRLGLLYCYTFGDWERGMEHLNSASNEGYTPAKEAIKAINNHLNAQIIIGVCDLLYYASNIIDERAEDYYSKPIFDGIDKKQRRETQAKKNAQGHTMSW